MALQIGKAQDQRERRRRSGSPPRLNNLVEQRLGMSSQIEVLQTIEYY